MAAGKLREGNLFSGLAWNLTPLIFSSDLSNRSLHNNSFYSPTIATFGNHSTPSIFLSFYFPGSNVSTAKMPEGDVVQPKKSFMGMPVSSKPSLKALRYRACCFNEPQCLDGYPPQLYNIVMSSLGSVPVELSAMESLPGSPGSPWCTYRMLS